MQVIHKYPLEIVGKKTVKLPRPLNILSVQVQNGEPCMWVQLEPHYTRFAEYTITMICTGIEFSGDIGQWIGTVQVGALVMHCFIKPNQ